MCHSSLTDFVSELVAGNSLFFPDGGLGGRVGGPGFGFLLSRPWESRDLAPRVLLPWCLPSLPLPTPSGRLHGSRLPSNGVLDSTALEAVRVVEAPPCCLRSTPNRWTCFKSQTALAEDSLRGGSGTRGFLGSLSLLVDRVQKDSFYKVRMNTRSIPGVHLALLCSWSLCALTTLSCCFLGEAAEGGTCHGPLDCL